MIHSGALVSEEFGLWFWAPMALDPVPPLSSLRMIRRRRRLQERRQREALLSGIEISDPLRVNRRRHRSRRQISRIVQHIFPSWLTSRPIANHQQSRERNGHRVRSDGEEYFLLSVELICLFYAVITFAVLLWFRILAYYYDV